MFVVFAVTTHQLGGWCGLHQNIQFVILLLLLTGSCPKIHQTV